MNIKKIRKFAEQNARTSPQDALRYVNSLSDYLRDIQEGDFRSLRVEQLAELESLISMICHMMGFERDSFYKDYEMTGVDYEEK